MADLADNEPPIDGGPLRDSNFSRVAVDNQSANKLAALKLRSHCVTTTHFDRPKSAHKCHPKYTRKSISDSKENHHSRESPQVVDLKQQSARKSQQANPSVTNSRLRQGALYARRQHHLSSSISGSGAISQASFATVKATSKSSPTTTKTTTKQAAPALSSSTNIRNHQSLKTRSSHAVSSFNLTDLTLSPLSSRRRSLARPTTPPSTRLGPRKSSISSSSTHHLLRTSTSCSRQPWDNQLPRLGLFSTPVSGAAKSIRSASARTSRQVSTVVGKQSSTANLTALGQQKVPATTTTASIRRPYNSRLNLNLTLSSSSLSLAVKRVKPSPRPTASTTSSPHSLITTSTTTTATTTRCCKPNTASKARDHIKSNVDKSFGVRLNSPSSSRDVDYTCRCSSSTSSSNSSIVSLVARQPSKKLTTRLSSAASTSNKSPPLVNSNNPSLAHLRSSCGNNNCVCLPKDTSDLNCNNKIAPIGPKQSEPISSTRADEQNPNGPVALCGTTKVASLPKLAANKSPNFAPSNHKNIATQENQLAKSTAIPRLIESNSKAQIWPSSDCPPDDAPLKRKISSPQTSTQTYDKLSGLPPFSRLPNTNALAMISDDQRDHQSSLQRQQVTTISDDPQSFANKSNPGSEDEHFKSENATTNDSLLLKGPLGLHSASNIVEQHKAIRRVSYPSTSLGGKTKSKTVEHAENLPPKQPLDTLKSSKFDCEQNNNSNNAISGILKDIVDHFPDENQNDQNIASKCCDTNSDDGSTASRKTMDYQEDDDDDQVNCFSRQKRKSKSDDSISMHRSESLEDHMILGSPLVTPPPSELELDSEIGSSSEVGICEKATLVQQVEHIDDDLSIIEKKLGQIDIPILTKSISERYELDTRPFARGKFAQVKRCFDKTTEQYFAAKCIKKRRRLVDIREEILLEIEALKLSYCTEYIVKLFEVYETPTEMILILEMANGGELQRVIDMEDKIEEGIVIRMTRQILEGLTYLHKQQIAHLDIKPQNLLLTDAFPNGDIKLCDFGLSRRITKDCEIREICGTPDYVAPEILRYDPISLATDMWSLGVLTYVLLSGYTPFGGENKQVTFSNITMGVLEFPGEIFANTSKEAIDFIEKLLRQEPSSRMSSHQARKHQWLTS